MIRFQPRLAVLAAFAGICSIACGGQSPPDASLSSQEAAATNATSSAAPSLGAAASFAVLAGTAVTCTNATVTGDVGVYPGAAITQTSCPVTGSLHFADAAAAGAHNAFILAYDDFAKLACGTKLATLDVNQTLTPGTYCFDAAATATDHVLTLDGTANDTWIFKIGTLGTGALTGTGFSVVMKDGSTPPCNNVFWWVAEATTMTTSKFVGTVLAGMAITFTGGTFNGDALAKAAVTMTGTAAVTACAPGAGSPPPPICKNKDFVTGGGWIKGGSNKSKANFAVAGGIKRGKFWGHLAYQDPARYGLKVKGTGVTAYTAIDSTTRRIEGTAKINGHRGYTYAVQVSDKGEPGRNDTFAISLSNGYSASGVLGGGNIQLHQRLSCDRDGDHHDDDDDGDDDDHDCDDDHDHNEEKGDRR